MDHYRPLDTRFPELLRSGRRFRSIFNPIPAPAIVEMCGFAGFDVVIVDNEHGSADFQTTENMLRAARASGILPIVRCLEHDIPRVLDLGPSGLQIPMVNSAAHAAELVRKVKYPQPDGKGGITGGKRGSAFSSRAAGFGAFGGPDHTKRSNEGVALVVQIETPEGIGNAAAIAAVSGVDSVFVGTNDLAHSMGHDNRSGDAPVQAAIERAVKAIVAAGKCAGLPAFTTEDEDKFAAWGARFFAVGTTGLILKAFRDVAQAGK
jgi:4-hydroxy-2-oxoheptanedioate aldolase